MLVMKIERETFDTQLSEEHLVCFCFACVNSKDNMLLTFTQEVQGDPCLHLPRILCLHGGGSNAKIFQAQCRKLNAQLKPYFPPRLCQCPGRSFKKSARYGILRKAPHVKRKYACFPQASKYRHSKLYSLGKPDEMLSGSFYSELATPSSTIRSECPLCEKTC
jgi:hypothetical protein